jgi:FAD/FMN-containing dehydrogenase
LRRDVSSRRVPRACRADLARGGGTSQCGQGVNAAVVIDCSKYMGRVLAIDPAARIARVETGAVCDALRDAAEAHRLTFAPTRRRIRAARSAG